MEIYLINGKSVTISLQSFDRTDTVLEVGHWVCSLCHWLGGGSAPCVTGWRGGLLPVSLGGAVSRDKGPMQWLCCLCRNQQLKLSSILP